jgi:hypothetical protein
MEHTNLGPPIRIMNKSGKQTGRFVKAIVAVMLCGLAIAAARAVEPEYQGKTVSEWLDAMDANLTEAEFYTARNQNVDPAQFRDQKHQQAQEAIRQMGTNALPTLLDLVSVGERNRRKLARKIKSQDIRESLRDSNPECREVIRGLAVDALVILGTNAEPAIPQLSKWLHDNPDCWVEATHALLRMSPKGFAVLTNVVNDTNDMARGLVIWELGREPGGDPKMIMPIMFKALKDPDTYNRGNAAEYLGGRDAELVIPILIPLLDGYKGDFYTIKGVAHALSSYGPAAKAAVPKLFNLYTNAVVSKDRQTAGDWGILIWALQAIDKEAAGRAEEFLVNSGPLNYARDGYSQTKLKNGLELIAGGYLYTEIPTPTNRFLASAELLDPKTGKWTKTGEMNVARYDHKATLLRDGKVLVEGGHGSYPLDAARRVFPNIARPSLSSKELYDPATGIWTVVTNK